MSNRPDPRIFGTYSYYLALASTIITVLVLLLGLFVPQIAMAFWLVLVTSAIGVFLGLAARSDLKHSGSTPEVERHVRIGVRVNLVYFVLMLIYTIVTIIFSLISGIGG